MNQVVYPTINKPKFVIGGIGDLYQTLDDAKLSKDLMIITHYKNAQELYQPFNLFPRFYFYEELDANTMQDINKILAECEPLRRSIYPYIDIPYSSYLQAQNIIKSKEGEFSKVIGLHPIGSKFSNEFWGKRNKPLKYLPEEFLMKIIEPQNLYILFGTTQELNEYQNILGMNNVIKADYPIWDSLAFIDFCDLIIGVDSAIKSVSSMRKIKTLCLVGDYEDAYRDKVFIEPYVHEKVMDIIKFTELNDEVVNEILRRSKE